LIQTFVSDEFILHFEDFSKEEVKKRILTLNISFCTQQQQQSFFLFLKCRFIMKL